MDMSYHIRVQKEGGLPQRRSGAQEGLETLQAEYNAFDDSHNTWRERCEALENQASAQVVNDLGARIVSDNLHEHLSRELMGLEKDGESTKAYTLSIEMALDDTPWSEVHQSCRDSVRKYNRH